eukprot:1972039-Pyramimonas_sp.AAC.1
MEIWKRWETVWKRFPVSQLAGLGGLTWTAVCVCVCVSVCACCALQGATGSGWYPTRIPEFEGVKVTQVRQSLDACGPARSAARSSWGQRSVASAPMSPISQGSTRTYGVREELGDRIEFLSDKMAH